MARVTVEDCLDHVENRFELVIKASHRAHALELGAADPMVPRENDKPTVIALREIAAGYDVESSKADAADEVEEEAAAKEVLSATDETTPSAEDTQV